MSNILLENNFAKVTTMKVKQGNALKGSTFKGNYFEDRSLKDSPVNNNLEEHNCILNLSHGNCKARVSLHGGQVLSYQPAGHKDVLWLSEQANYNAGKAIRGGVPICWPWFGPIEAKQLNKSQEIVGANTEKVKPQKHGFARQLLWDVTSINADASGITLVLTLSGEREHQVWPNAFILTQALFFGEHFQQSLSMTNLSQEDVKYSAALHNYFAVSNPSNVSIDALTNVNYLDELTSKLSIQKQGVSCVGEIDRKYYSSEAMTIVDKKWQRKVSIVSVNCQEWVLWNPGTSLAEKMDDIHSGGEHEYVCLEPANTTLQTLPAGETVVISQEINIEKYS